MPPDILARTPFGTWFWPGVLLALTVGVPSGFTAWGAMARKVWVAVIGFIAGLQPLIFAWGLAIALLGAANHRERSAAHSEGRTGVRRPGRAGSKGTKYAR